MFEFKNPTLITLTAPTCSGKSFLLNAITEKGVGRIVSTTTRDMRNMEREGVDYYFISKEQSLHMEDEGKFFELIEFRGTRYGVTHEEMKGKMGQRFAPAVVLEPKGLEIYEQKCYEAGWDIFKIYVHVTEDKRIQRLTDRTKADILADLDTILGGGNGAHKTFAFNQANILASRILPRIDQQTDRLLSMTGDERRWQNQNTWDAIVPGDDLTKAIAMIQQGVTWRNKRVSEINL